MNYIRHLNAFFVFVRRDNRLACSHVSLYLALFQYWNFNRFQNPFPVYRTDIMQLCKIGSKNTYHKCIKELHEAKYILYHPAPSPYQPVKISMIRLDKQQPADPTQLALFSSCPNNDTTHVPLLTGTGTDIDTTQVPNLGQLIKQTNNKTSKVCNTPTHFLTTGLSEENKHTPPHVPNPVHTKKACHTETGEVPTLTEVERYFKEKDYPAEEAARFFYYNQSKNWMLTEKFKVRNWKSLAKKWMLNYHSGKPAPAERNLQQEIQYLYESFIEGKKITRQILPEHFAHLQLQLTAQLLQQAKQERIAQVTGTNQNSLIQLWEAYLKGEESSPLLQKDKPNIIAIAQRMAVINHFQTLKNQAT